MEIYKANNNKSLIRISLLSWWMVVDCVKQEWGEAKTLCHRRQEGDACKLHTKFKLNNKHVIEVN